MKTIGLIDVDSKYPNLALMKISAYHKGIGNQVLWYDCFEDFDEIYMSKIFNFTPDYGYVMPNLRGELHRGGTGYDITTTLPEEIDRTQPDYTLYPGIDSRTSYGFLTRGCPNHCKWCVVPKKEGNIKPYMDIDEITLNGERPYAVLMDNNILAADYGLQQIEKIADRRYHVDFNQALDARLINPEIAGLLAKVKWIGSLVRFGCDTPKQIEDCERAMDMMTAKGFRGQWLLYCIIMGDIHECVNRISYWKHSRYKNRVRIMAQPFRDPFVVGSNASPNGNNTSPDGQEEKNSTPRPNSPTSDSPKTSPARAISNPPQWQKDLAHWANQRQAWWSTEFADFTPRTGFRCKQYL